MLDKADVKDSFLDGAAPGMGDVAAGVSESWGGPSFVAGQGEDFDVSAVSIAEQVKMMM